jgi:transcriptional regulator with XRE-family HTH domain
MPLNELIREKRIALGLSKRKLAACLGITHPAVVFWEDGSRIPTPKHLLAMAKLFQVPIGTLQLSMHLPKTEAPGVS